MNKEQITAKLVSFIQDNLLPDDQKITVDKNTQLLDLGVLDSLKTAILMNYIRDGLGAQVPHVALTSENFASPGNIAAMVADLVVAADS